MTFTIGCLVQVVGMNWKHFHRLVVGYSGQIKIWVVEIIFKSLPTKLETFIDQQHKNDQIDPKTIP